LKFSPKEKNIKAQGNALGSEKQSNKNSLKGNNKYETLSGFIQFMQL
jgi:hypothetical protein